LYVFAAGDTMYTTCFSWFLSLEGLLSSQKVRIHNCHKYVKQLQLRAVICYDDRRPDDDQVKLKHVACVTQVAENTHISYVDSINFLYISVWHNGMHNIKNK
jgi:hypothetical protein